ncbi:MAG: class I SAM-dependent methyltransferase [Candidatus Limnocylindria bacterium]
MSVDDLSRALTHSEKVALAASPGVPYWREFYSQDTEIGEPTGAERLRVFREALRSVDASGLWLDAGCGIGVMAQHFRASGLRMCGVDVSASRLEEARRVSGLPLVPPGSTPSTEEHLLQAPVEHLPHADAHFDGAYASSVLEYSASLKLALAELRRVVRRHGFLVFNLPNAFSVFRISHALVRRRSDYYRLVPRWAYWPWEIGRILTGSGWEIRRFSYYGTERSSMGPALEGPLRRRLGDRPWAASYVLVVARKA